MDQLKFKLSDDWQQLINVETREIIQKGHKIDCVGLLIALGYDIEIIEEWEVYEDDED